MLQPKPNIFIVLQSITEQEDWLISEEIADPFEVSYLFLQLNSLTLTYLGLIFSPLISRHITALCRLS